jgi:hypothetical protein
VDLKEQKTCIYQRVFFILSCWVYDLYHLSKVGYHSSEKLQIISNLGGGNSTLLLFFVVTYMILCTFTISQYSYIPISGFLKGLAQFRRENGEVVIVA